MDTRPRLGVVALKITTSWYSDRLQREVSVARWGEAGAPILMFPTAGGDAEEIERFHIPSTLSGLLDEGRIRIYSCDSVAGAAMLGGEGTHEHQMWLLDQFQEYVGRELVPAIRTDCEDPEIEIIAAGASIGAYNALTATCRFPEAFRAALCMSGTYDLSRFLDGPTNDDFIRASPVHFLSSLAGPALERLRTRFVLLASGEGEAEDISESWRAAHELGSQGVPNRVDSWGVEWIHDWPTWRNMLHYYLPDLIQGVRPHPGPPSA